MNLFDYNELDDRQLYKRSIGSSFIVAFFIVCLIIFLIIYQKKMYYESELVIDNNYAITYILKEDLHYLTKNHSIEINKNNYFYKIDEIELINEARVGYLVKMKIYSLDNYQKETSLNYRVLVKEESLFNYLFRVIGGVK